MYDILAPTTPQTKGKRKYDQPDIWSSLPLMKYDHHEVHTIGLMKNVIALKYQ